MFPLAANIPPCLHFGRWQATKIEVFKSSTLRGYLLALMVNRGIPLFSDVLVASNIHQSESALIESKATEGHREYP